MANDRERGPGEPPSGEGDQGERSRAGTGDAPEAGLAPYGDPIDLNALIQSMVYRLGATLAPRVLQALSRGLRVITYGRLREVAFATSVFVAAAVLFIGLVVAASMGLHLGLPISTAVVLFGSIFFAAIGNGVAVSMGRLTTPELEYVLDLYDIADEQYAAINAYAGQLRASGVPEPKIEAEVGPRRKQVFAALMSGLKKAGHHSSLKLTGTAALAAGAREGADAPLAADASAGDAPPGRDDGSTTT